MRIRSVSLLNSVLLHWKIFSLLPSDPVKQGRTNGFIKYIYFRLNGSSNYIPLIQENSWNQLQVPQGATENIKKAWSEAWQARWLKTPCLSSCVREGHRAQGGKKQLQTGHQKHAGKIPDRSASRYLTSQLNFLPGTSRKQDTLQPSCGKRRAQEITWSQSVSPTQQTCKASSIAYCLAWQKRQQQKQGKLWQLKGTLFLPQTFFFSGLQYIFYNLYTAFSYTVSVTF